MLGQDRAGRPIVRSDVLEERAVAGLLRMVVDDQINMVDRAAKVVGLYVNHGNAVVVGFEFAVLDHLPAEVEVETSGSQAIEQEPPSTVKVKSTLQLSMLVSGYGVNPNIKNGFVLLFISTSYSTLTVSTISYAAFRLRPI